jgi:hypothetical protein
MTDPDIDSLKAANGGYWGEHPEYPVADWAHDVMEGAIRQGYWEWVAANQDRD